MINRFEIAGEKFLLRFLDFLLLALDQLLHLHFFLHRAVEPIDPGHIGTEVETQLWVVTQKERDLRGVRVIEQERRLIGRAGIRNDLKSGAGNYLLGAGLDLFERLHR